MRLPHELASSILGTDTRNQEEQVKHSIRWFVAAASIFAVHATQPAALHAQRGPAAGAQPVVATAGALEWGPAPAILDSRARMAVIEGNPAEAGEFTLRLRMPAGYRIAPHYHPVTEHVTVLQGTFLVGMGETFDESEMTALPVGSFGAIPAGMRHYALAQDEVVIQLHGMGPWRLIYVDPADRPNRR